jgi:hypothetical protein
MRSSVPMLNLQIFDVVARCVRCSTGTPEPPWITNGCIAQCLDGADALFVQPIIAFLLKVHIADRDRHGINTSLTGKLRGFLRVGTSRRFAAIIANKANLTLAGNPGSMGHLRNARCLCDVIGQRFARTIKHQAGEAAIKRFLAFFDGVTMVQDAARPARMRFPPDGASFCQHGQRRVLAAAWSSLQDHRRVFGFGGGHIGAHVFPAQADKAADGVALFQGRLKDLGERCTVIGLAHLNGLI